MQMLTVKKVKIDTEYRFGDVIVKVTKRIKNSYTEKWHYGFGSKHQKIKHRKETTFLLNNKIEVFAKELSTLNGL
jgi:hypothetical protein